MNKLVILALGCLLVGCTTRMVDFTVLSSRNCNIQGERGNRVTGESGQWWMAFPLPIPLQSAPHIKAAVDNALEKGGGDTLVDGIISVVRKWYFFAVYTGYRVEGTVVNTGNSPIKTSQ